MNWHDYSHLLSKVASCYYKKLSPFWPFIPSYVRRDISSALVIKYPWIQNRFLKFQKMKAKNIIIEGSRINSLNFNNFQVNFSVIIIVYSVY